MAEKATRTLLKDKNGNKLLPITTWGSITGDIANQTDLNGILSTNNTMTNCITKIPQNVKIETSGNTVTLKAGSVIKTPDVNDLEMYLSDKLEYIGTTYYYLIFKTKQDMSVTIDNDSKKEFCIFVDWEYPITSSNLIDVKLSAFDKTECKTLTATSADLYSNLPRLIFGAYSEYESVCEIYRYPELDETGEPMGDTVSVLSMPLALITNDGTNCSKVQAFNGLWYFDTTIAIDSGVKILFSDGLNDDGTYQNEEYIFDKVQMVNELGNNAANTKVIITKPGQSFENYYLPVIFRAVEYYESEEMPPVETLTNNGLRVWRNPITNKNYFTRGLSNIMNWTEFVGLVPNININFKNSTYSISNLDTPTVFQTADNSKIQSMCKYDATTQTLEINT